MAFDSQPHISCKIKHESGEGFDDILCDFLIKPLFGHTGREMSFFD